MTHDRNLVELRRNVSNTHFHDGRVSETQDHVTGSQDPAEEPKGAEGDYRNGLGECQQRQGGPKSRHIVESPDPCDDGEGEQRPPRGRGEEQHAEDDRQEREGHRQEERSGPLDGPRRQPGRLARRAPARGNARRSSVRTRAISSRGLYGFVM